MVMLTLNILFDNCFNLFSVSQYQELEARDLLMLIQFKYSLLFRLVSGLVYGLRVTYSQLKMISNYKIASPKSIGF